MFYKPNNKIIIVDDVQEDIDLLSREFYKIGVGCKTFLYDLSFDTPLQDVRIAFFDIGINPSGGSSDGQRFNSIATAIKQYIHKDNGPFALIFWTKDTNDVEKLCSYISKVHSDCPKPFLVSQIDKADFVENSQQKLQNTLTDKTLELLFDFEDISSKAATKTIDQIYKIIPANDQWGANANFKENFEKIFSNICISATGNVHANKDPDRAVYEALIPILSHHITSMRQKGKWSSYLTSLTSQNSILIDDFNSAVLNTIFHIDLSVNYFDYTQRGAVFKYYPIPPYSRRFEYFNKMNQQSGDLFRKFIKFKQGKMTQDEQNKFKDSSKFVVIEISAACDHSQNKSRNYKYLLGLLTPEISLGKLDLTNISESVFYKDLPVISYKDQNLLIWVNLNYSLSDFEINNGIGEPIFLLKKEIIDMIGNRYANHISRIGITTFK